MKRIEWIDAAKGILIILVVLGHAHSPYELIGGGKNLIINSFHMAGFFILSGLTFSVKRPFVENFIHKVQSLLLPYLCFSLIYLAYLWLKSVVFGGPDFKLLSGLTSLFLPVSGRSSTSVYGLWFFPCLFLAEIALYTIVKLKRRNSIVFAVILVSMAMTLHRFLGVVSIISILPLALCFMAVGYYFRQKIEIFRQSWASAIISLIVFIVALSINWFCHGHIFDLSSLTLGYWPLYVVCGLSGSLFTYCMASRLTSMTLFTTLGRDSMYYYGLHYCLIGLVERIPYIGATGQTLIVFAVLYQVIAVKHKCFKRDKI